MDCKTEEDKLARFNSIFFLNLPCDIADGNRQLVELSWCTSYGFEKLVESPTFYDTILFRIIGKAFFLPTHGKFTIPTTRLCVLINTQTIAGFSAIIVRDFLMKVMDRLFTDDDVVRHFKTNKSDATAIIEELLKIEYVEPVEIRKHQFWSVTTAGRTLALASAAKPILRKTADKKITELLGRVATINSSNQYVYAVTKVVVFGSYLSEQERINDVDIAIALEKRP